MRYKVAIILLAVFFTGLQCRGQAPKKPDNEAVLVIYNTNDPLSLDLAKYYAEKRKIPADHVVGLDCPSNEEISRADYDESIAGPLRKMFDEKGWWKTHETAAKQTIVDENAIRFVVLMRGMPLKVSPTTGYPGDKKEAGAPEIYTSKNEASVDSELACLGFFSHTISGGLVNPYYRGFTRIVDANFPQLMLVCRLDGPTTDIVREMIDDGMEAEKTGLWGFAYIDSRNIKDGGLATGDKWLANVAEDAKKHGIPVIHDNGPDNFPANYPMRYVAFYYGWYAENAYGPFLRADFRFQKGAIACHMHSFSASSVRDPGKFWVGPLLSRGATAVLGNVYEPFLALTPNLDLFHERLENGFTFAESAYMSMQVVSWMTVCVGDPLYKPFAGKLDDNFENLPKPAAEWAAYRTGAVTWFKEYRVAGEKKLQKSARDLRSGIVYEALGSLQAGENDFLGALESFAQARKFYTNGEDVIRTAIHEVSILRAMGKTQDAHAIAQTVLRSFGSLPPAELLKKADAPPPAPPASPK